MVRLARYSADAIVEAAVALTAQGGASAASMAAIAQKIGAPTGSLYHRFDSRAAILATGWIAIHGDFIRQVVPPLTAGDGLKTALAVTAWARRDILRARFLLLHEIGALLETAPPVALRDEIQRQEDEIDAAFRIYLDETVATPGGADEEGAARARFLLFDAPIALLKPHLLANQTPPDFIDSLIREMHRAIAPAAQRHSLDRISA
jgi:AcrR family transcriptional regulator